MSTLLMLFEENKFALPLHHVPDYRDDFIREPRQASGFVYTSEECRRGSECTVGIDRGRKAGCEPVKRDVGQNVVKTRSRFRVGPFEELFANP